MYGGNFWRFRRLYDVAFYEGSLLSWAIYPHKLNIPTVARHFWSSFPWSIFGDLLLITKIFIADCQHFSPPSIFNFSFLLFFSLFLNLSLFWFLDLEIMPTDYSSPTPRPAHNIRDLLSPDLLYPHNISTGMCSAHSVIVMNAWLCMPMCFARVTFLVPDHLRVCRTVSASLTSLSHMSLPACWAWIAKNTLQPFRSRQKGAIEAAIGVLRTAVSISSNTTPLSTLKRECKCDIRAIILPSIDPPCSSEWGSPAWRGGASTATVASSRITYSRGQSRTPTFWRRQRMNDSNH